MISLFHTKSTRSVPFFVEVMKFHISPFFNIDKLRRKRYHNFNSLKQMQ